MWQPDRLLHDLVFRLQRYASDNWELGNECFLFYKIKYLVDQYAKFLSLRENFPARNILELGMWDEGSLAFWFEYFDPEKHVGVDVQKKEDSQYFKLYKSPRGLEQRIRTYWGIDQGDSAKLRDIVQAEFQGPLATFETAHIPDSRQIGAIGRKIPQSDSQITLKIPSFGEITTHQI